MLETIAETIGRNIDRLFEDQDITYRKATSVLRMSNTTVYRIRKGRKIPDIYELLLFAKLLEVPYQELLEGVEDLE